MLTVNNKPAATTLQNMFWSGGWRNRPGGIVDDDVCSYLPLGVEMHAHGIKINIDITIRNVPGPPEPNPCP